MIELVRVTGSFATSWLVIWFASALVLLLFYPLVRRQLFNWHPATVSRLLLLLLAFPFLLSLSTSVMLFLPVVEDNLVSAHCHHNCQSHVPLVDSIWLSVTGLVVSLLMLLVVLRKLLFNLFTAKLLMSHLSHLAEDAGRWLLLQDAKPVVFTLGWWQNKVFITRGLLRRCSEQDIEIILRHEYEHGRRLDNVRLLLAKLFLLVLPVRLADRFYADLHFLTESACDFAAAERYGELEVAETLLRVQKLVPREFDYLNNPLTSAFTGSEVERRIMNLVKGPQHFHNLCYVQTTFLLVFVVLSCTLVDPVHHGIEWLLKLL
ncbi:MAG: M56 family metallopeptidase [Pseudomonadales bacterium]